MKTTLLVAAFLLALFAAFVAYGPHPATIKTQGQWQDNRHVIEEYIEHGSGAHAVLVGSSLSRRFDLESASACIYNLAVSGESSLTGLRTIVDSGNHPRQILIEINVPQRPVNARLVREATNSLSHLLPILRVKNSPVNLALSFLYQRIAPQSNETQSPAVFESALAAQFASYSQPIDRATLEQDMKQFVDLVAILERRGTRVEFFEMPVDPSLENLARAVQVRGAFRDAFPGRAVVGHEALSQGFRIETIDGVHLKSPAAALTLDRLRPYFDGACRNPPG